MPKEKLTAKQIAFVEHYVNDPDCQWNAAKAAIAAGYAANCAKQIGYENLTKPYLMQVVEAKKAEIKAKIEEKAEFTRLEARDKHNVAYRLAKAIRRPDVMVAATREQSKLYGLIIDKSAVLQGNFEVPEALGTDEAIAYYEARIKLLRDTEAAGSAIADE